MILDTILPGWNVVMGVETRMGGFEVHGMALELEGEDVRLRDGFGRVG